MAQRPLYDRYMTAQIADVSTAEAVVIPVLGRGRLKHVKTVLGGAITTANSTVTVSVNGVSKGTITVAYASSAAGDVDTLDLDVPVDEGDWITVATDGGSSTAAKLGIGLIIREIGL